MAKPLLTVELGGEWMDEADQIRQALGILAEQLPDMRPVNEAQFATLEGVAREQFYSQGAHLGTPWISYRDAGERKYFGYKQAVIDSQRGARARIRQRAKARRDVKAGRAAKWPAPRKTPLLRWITGSPRQRPQPGEVLYPSFFSASPWNIRRSFPDGFEWGSQIPYARSHQRGQGTQRWDKSRIPKRAILANHKKLRGPLVRNIHVHVHETLRQFKQAAPGITLDSTTGLAGARPGRAGLRAMVRRSL